MDEKIILTVSRLMERKGQDIVIKTLPIVKKKFPNIKYILVGTEVIGNEKDKLQKLVKKFDLEDVVIFAGSVNNNGLLDYYTLCNVFILTPKEVRTGNFLDVEGFGIVYLEAGCCEKPVIGSKSGGVPDAVMDDKTGLLVDPGDVKQTAEAILRLFEHPELGKKLGKHARKRVVEELNWKNISQKILKIYRTISSSYKA